MSSKKIFTVIGATGTQGGAIISHISKNKSIHLRAVTRDTSSSSASSLKKSYPEVELVQGSLDDVASLKAAFKDASYVFVVTDFFSCGLDLAKEIQQGKNAVDALVQVPTLERLIWSGLPDARTLKVPFVNVLHFNGKPDIKNYIKEKGLWEKTTEVCNGAFMENFFKFTDVFTPKKQADGSYILRLPLHPHSTMPYASVSDDFGPLVEAIVTSDKYYSQNINHIVEELNPLELLDVWASNLNLQAKFVEETNDETVARFEGLGFPKAMAVDMMENFACFKENPDWYEQNVPGVIRTTDVLGKQNCTSWEAFVKKNDWSKVL
ncbi:NAD(P)-binding protein [Atractiella rhizophila]|nr:NAD(P)-binding protein [Atractiella rhizophila]